MPITDSNKRQSIILSLSFFALGFLILISITFLIQWKDWGNLPGNLFILFVLNLNIILLLVLGLLVFRNLIKLYFERKHKVLGARFRTKLVLAFVSLSLIPAILLFIVASNLINRSIESWFNVHNEEYLKRSLNVAQVYYKSSVGRAILSVRSISNGIIQKDLLNTDANKKKELKTLVMRHIIASDIGMVKILDHRGKEILALENASRQKGRFVTPLDELIEMGFKGKEHSITKQSQDGHLIEAVVPIHSEEQQAVLGVILFTYFDPFGLTEEINYIKDAFNDYQRRKVFQRPLKMTYMITFLLMTLLIVFSATWFGFYLARGITVPIQKLAEGTKEVAAGNLKYKVNVDAKDEIGMLVESFNQMTEDLNKALTGLRQTNLELDSRRRHIEIILTNITSGVMTLDSDGLITTVNPAAERILSLHNDQITQKPYYEIMATETLSSLKKLIDGKMEGKKADIYEEKIQIPLYGHVKTLLVSILSLYSKEEDIGSLIVFDDLTQLIKVQKIATWQEVARRLAHEIKNPLTPIQLSAQRLWKKFKNLKGDEHYLMQECTETIVQEVQGLKTLIDEFAQFARMPEPDLKPEDLRTLLSQTISMYSQIHPDCILQLKNGDSIPPLMIDKDQIKRVIINLLDNAYEAIRDNRKIMIAASFNPQEGFAYVRVIDWGTGISSEDKDKLLELYFSRKKGGTGLGLAIVNRIIADHHGTLTIEDNEPRGTKVTFSLPQA